MRFQLRFRVREAKTHLEYFAYTTWDEAEVDEDGIPLTKGRIDRYQVQLKQTTDAAGTTPAESADGKPILLNKLREVKDDGDADEHYHLYFGHMSRPKRWYVTARIRVRGGRGCWSDWSEWTTPVRPFQGESDPEPPIPANTSLTFDHAHSSRHDPLRAIVAGDYVGPWDVPGGDTEDDMARYHVQLQWSNDGGTSWQWPPKKHTVRDRDDNDGRWRSIFHNIDRRKLYRYRVCSEDRFNRRGDWGPGAPNANARLDGWSAGVDPKTFDEAPPTPVFVMADIDRSRLHVELAEPDATWKPRIDYWEWEVYYDAVSGSPIQKDRMHRNLSKTFPLRKPAGHTVIVRARAYTASDEVSAWGQATAAAHVPPIPAIGSATFDTHGTRHARYRVLVPVTVNDASHNDNVQTIVVQMVHKTVNSTPDSGDPRNKDRVDIGDSPQSAVFKNIPKRHYVFVRALSIDGDDKRSPWTSWVALGRPIDSGASATPPAPTGVQVIANTDTPRRVVALWDEPDDDEAVRWRVVWRRGSTIVDTQRVRNNRSVYRVPKAFVGVSHTAEVIAINDLGVESSFQGPGGTPSDDDASGFEPGDLKPRARSAIPAGWLNCNGQCVDPAIYPALFAAIGFAFGQSGSLFCLPDLRGRVSVGVSSLVALASSEGLPEGSRLQIHAHLEDGTATGVATDATVSGLPGATEPDDFAHDHGTNTSGASISLGNPTTIQSNISAGGTQQLATDTHGHPITGRTGQRDQTHAHLHAHGTPHFHGPHGHGGHGHQHGHGSANKPFQGHHWLVKT
jgi:microcystin-dependent protein